MVDKSVPYMNILMRRDAGAPILRFPLPEGFRFTFFQNGDEKAWARTEASVLEFDDEIDALLYFQQKYLPFLPELERRLVFIETADGEKIANAMAWHGYTGMKRELMLGWVAVKPAYQGRGLGKALVSHTLELFRAIEGDRDIYLHTQTWSHTAVRVYIKNGFYITGEQNVTGYDNSQYPQNLALLREIGLDFIK